MSAVGRDTGRREGELAREQAVPVPVQQQNYCGRTCSSNKGLVAGLVHVTMFLLKDWTMFLLKRNMSLPYNKVLVEEDYGAMLQTEKKILSGLSAQIHRQEWMQKRTI